MKKKVYSSISSLIGGVVSGIIKNKISDKVEDLKENIDKIIEETEVKIMVFTEELIKKITNVFLILLGVIFGLVGIAKYLSSNFSIFQNGIGYLVVGVVIIIIAWLGNHVEFK